MVSDLVLFRSNVLSRLECTNRMLSVGLNWSPGQQANIHTLGLSPVLGANVAQGHPSGSGE